MGEFIGIAGLLTGLAVLIFLALRGIDIVFAALLSALVVIVTNGLPLADTLLEGFALGPLGTFTFAGKFFLLFVAGSVFGRSMSDSGAAASIATWLLEKLGKERVLMVTVIGCALLTYGGVVVFVVIFAMYPLGLQLLRDADIPKRLFCAAMALGAGTFTMTALPGTPSIHNVISATALGTDLYAAPLLGLLGAGVMLALGLWYLERQRQLAKARGEGFKPGPNDTALQVAAGRRPPPLLAALPLVIVLATILVPRIVASEALGPVGLAVQLLEFAQGNTALWTSIALFMGSLTATGLAPDLRSRSLDTMGQGTQAAIMPLINTSVVIGFGGVVTLTQGFQSFVDLAVTSDGSPLLSIFASISLISAITGSASGGLQIFMQTLAPGYLALGVEPEVLHRVATIAAGGFDSLPHCGAVVAMLTITQLTHRQGYKDVAVVTILIPVIAGFAVIAAAALGLR